MIKEVKDFGIKFECETTNSRYGFKHHCKMYHNDILLHTSQVQYYNRTWEPYQYYSVIKKTAYDYMQQEIKSKHNWYNSMIVSKKKLTKKRKQEIEKELTYTPAFGAVYYSEKKL